MAAQQAITFNYDSNLEVVSSDNQKVGLASSGKITLNRPDKIHGTRTGGFADIEFAFDGKTLTFFGKNASAYAQVDAPGTIDQLIDVLRDKYHRPVPGADLLLSNIYGQLEPEVKNTKDLGAGVIGGVECDHLAFRTSDMNCKSGLRRATGPIPAATSSPAPSSQRRRNTRSTSGHGKPAARLPRNTSPAASEGGQKAVCGGRPGV